MTAPNPGDRGLCKPADARRGGFVERQMISAECRAGFWINSVIRTGITAQDYLDLLGSGIAASQPDHFGWCAVEAVAFSEIAVLCDNAETPRFGEVPNLVVGRLIESKPTNVG